MSRMSLLQLGPTIFGGTHYVYEIQGPTGTNQNLYKVYTHEICMHNVIIIVPMTEKSRNDVCKLVV